MSRGDFRCLGTDFDAVCLSYYLKYKSYEERHFKNLLSLKDKT